MREIQFMAEKLGLSAESDNSDVWLTCKVRKEMPQYLEKLHELAMGVKVVRTFPNKKGDGTEVAYSKPPCYKSLAALMRINEMASRKSEESGGSPGSHRPGLKAAPLRLAGPESE